ncbi:hypothetical protein M426DRAFT_23337 [Hypoxylon sp. CI-4A]|nr:hypothetical protein M426DRAFT_23337 [Hypoxylon sp. CI-4A]
MSINATGLTVPTEPKHDGQVDPEHLLPDSDSLFGDPDESFGREHSPEPVIIPPHHNDPTYGLQWVRHGGGFSVHPEWTVQPSIESIILTLEKVVDPNKTFRVHHHWDGAMSKIYFVSYDHERLVLRVFLPVCPKTKTESEVATLRWTNENTRLPVPKVRCYDSTRENPIGFEWILMERMEGKPLFECWDSVTHGAKERIVKQIADYAARIFNNQFRGIGNIYPTKSHHISGHQPPVGEMASMRRLRLISADLRVMAQESTHEAHQTTATNMMDLVDRLRALEDDFFPSPPSHPGQASVYEDDESTDDDGYEQATKKLDKYYEPTMLWHDNISLDNILVDENGILCGVVDWACVCCIPLYEACQFPTFLQQAFDRLNEPFTPHRVTREQGDISSDVARYKKELMQYQLTSLRQLFLDEMSYLCPGWVETFRDQADLRDYEVAVQNCNDETSYKIVEEWLDNFEKRGDSDHPRWHLHERIML